MNRLRLPPVAAAAIAPLAVAATLAALPRASEAGPNPPADAGPPPPRFDAEPFGEERSTLPTPAEWKPTTPVSLTSSSQDHCRAYRLREWVKIRCSPLQTSAIALLGGSREGVAMFLDKPQWEGGPPPGGEIVFPVRRGDRRVIEWSTFGDSYEGVGAPEVAFMISESWVAGETTPVVVVR